MYCVYFLSLEWSSIRRLLKKSLVLHLLIILGSMRFIGMGIAFLRTFKFLVYRHLRRLLQLKNYGYH